MRAAVGGAAARRGAGIRARMAAAQTPTVVDPKLEVRTVTTGLNLPVQMQFVGDTVLGPREGDRPDQARPQRRGARGVLDLAVNSNSERGLLGITLDQDFKRNGHALPLLEREHHGADSAAGADVPLLGNRLDRYQWDGTR